MLSLDETIRDAVRQAVREVLQGELAALLREPPPSPPAPATSTDAQYITTQRAAEIAGVCEETIRNWVRRGCLRRRHAGRCLRIDKSELEHFIAEGIADTKAVDVHARAREILGTL